MKGSRDVIAMEENGEIVFNENTGCYEPTSQEWLEHPFVDEEKERLAGFDKFTGEQK
jgi:hypothetical protein